MAYVEEPPFEPARFDSVAASYRGGRLAYAPVLIQHAAKVARLSPETTVLDLGCGPGTIANAIAGLTGQVIGADPSEGMITAAREGAPDNVTYLQGSSYDLSFVDRPITLATFGRSFHWMDRDATLATLDGLITPGGCLAFFSESPIAGKGPQHAWWRAVNTYFRKAGDLSESDKELFGPNWERNEFVLARSAFGNIRYRGVLRTHSWTYDRVLQLALSRSVSSMEQLGDRLPEYEAGLKRTLKRFGKGPWKTLNHHKVMIASRPE